MSSARTAHCSSSPSAAHLRELRASPGLPAVDPLKEDRLRRTLGAHFRRERAEPLEYAMSLTAGEVATLVAMSPAARHVDAAELGGRVAQMTEPVRVTASFVASVYRPRRDPR